MNDTDADVVRLERILRANPAKLNLIPFNAVPGGLAYRLPSRERIVAIRDRLLAKDLRVSIRWSRGADARAACGLACPARRTPMIDLTGKSVLVTGGSRGIGRACSLMAARAGARVAVNYRVESPSANLVVEEIEPAF